MNRINHGVVAALLAVGCSASDSAPSPPPVLPPAPPASVAFAVINGYGPASVPVSSQVEAWSSAQPQNQVVTSWIGGTFVTDPEEWHATVAIANNNVTVTANLQTLNIAFQTQTYTTPTTSPKTVRFHVPAAPRGVILMLHGTGGSSLFIERLEARYFALKAISEGYAVIAPEAEESVAGDLNGDGNERWDVALNSANVDLQALNALLSSLIANGTIPATAPRYVMGMSNGGVMSISLGAVANSSVASNFPNLRFKAAVSYCAQGRQDAVAQTRTPTAWHLCGNDQNGDVSNATAQANSATLGANGVPAVALLHPATPLYDERFARVTGITVARSIAISAELRTAGYLDGSGLFLSPSSTISAAFSNAPGSFPVLSSLTGAQQQDVLAQISVMLAEHEFFSDWTSRALNWFAQYP